MTRNKISLEYDDAFNEIDTILKKVEVMNRAPILRKAVRKAANVFKRHYTNILPKSGMPDDKGRTPLAKSIKTRVRDRGESIVAVVGESRPSGEQYIAHLLSEGFKVHDTHVEGQKYLERSVAATKADVDRELVNGVRQAVKDL